MRRGALAALAFEEYRARPAPGEPARPEEYRARYQVPTDSWPAADAPHRSALHARALGAADGPSASPSSRSGADRLESGSRPCPVRPPGRSAN